MCCLAGPGAEAGGGRGELEVESREKRSQTPSVGKRRGGRLFPMQIAVTASL